MVQNNFCSTCTICDMGQPPHPSGQVTFACHLPRDKFCKKYLSDPALNGGSGTIIVNTTEVMLLTLCNETFTFPTHLFVAVYAKSISSSPSPVSVESSESELSFFAFLDLGSLSLAVFVLAGRFPFPLVPCKIIFRINQVADR